MTASGVSPSNASIQPRKALPPKPAWNIGPWPSVQRVDRIYRRGMLLASGRFAVLDDGKDFSLVPCLLVIEPRVDQQVVAVVRDGGMPWEIGRQREPSIG